VTPRIAVALVIVGAFALSACAGGSPPPQVSLKADQQAVDAAQVAVSQDQQALLADQNAAVACLNIGCGPDHTPADQSKLQSDTLKLQVARDHLTKDEG
jgi:hypothetical protein